MVALLLGRPRSPAHVPEAAHLPQSRAHGLATSEHHCPAPTQGEASAVQANSLIELARRALALTVHQLGLYRKARRGRVPWLE